MIDYKACYSIAKQIKAYRATPGNAPQILELLNRLAVEFDNDAKATEFLASEGLKDMADTFFRFRESIKWTECTTQRPPPARRSSSEVIERKPPPVQRPARTSYSDFAQDFATENDRGRFAKISPFVNDVPRQPANSPWHHDPVGDEPKIDFAATSRVSGNEQPIAAPVTAPVIERAPREDDWLADIDRLLEVIEEQRAESKEQRAEINRLKAELETRSSAAAAPAIPSPVEQPALDGESCPLGSPLSSPNTMDVTSDQQKEE
jgi:hypothetical protein